jgi:hypothetical protein
MGIVNSKKQKKCKVCPMMFYPNNIGDVCCSFECRCTLLRQKKIAKHITFKQVKKKAKTHKNYVNELQIVFNTWIKHRDAEKPCISCGVEQAYEWNASHFYGVGSHPSVRFDEYNVHKSCKKCNHELQGNFEEYEKRLPYRIGIEQFESLQRRRHGSGKLTISELKERIEYYEKLLK